MSTDNDGADRGIIAAEGPPGPVDATKRKRPPIRIKVGQRVAWPGPTGRRSGIVNEVHEDGNLLVLDDDDGVIRPVVRALATRVVARRRTGLIEPVEDRPAAPPVRVEVVVSAPELGARVGPIDVPGYPGLVAEYGVYANPDGPAYATAEVSLRRPGFEPAPGRLAGTSVPVEPGAPAEVLVAPANLLVVVRPLA
jgi:hypothetical protein